MQSNEEKEGAQSQICFGDFFLFNIFFLNIEYLKTNADIPTKQQPYLNLVYIHMATIKTKPQHNEKDPPRKIKIPGNEKYHAGCIGIFYSCLYQSNR
jgi:hypothetical protein